MQKFKTIGRDTHRHGRVACLADIDLVRRKLYVNVLESRGLNAGFQTVPNDALVTFRVQLLPSKNQAMVHQVTPNTYAGRHFAVLSVLRLYLVRAHARYIYMPYFAATGSVPMLVLDWPSSAGCAARVLSSAASLSELCGSLAHPYFAHKCLPRVRLQPATAHCTCTTGDFPAGVCR